MGIRKFLSTYSGLDRSIYFLCLAQVINSIGHFVHPFLTMFLTQKIGMDAVEAGTYVMLSAAAWVPGSLLGGKIADQFGRKRVLVIFQFLAAVDKGLEEIRQGKLIPHEEVKASLEKWLSA